MSCERTSDHSKESPPRYYGKYRGTVINNVDPLRIGRLMVIVPDVSMIPSTWAMPCVPWGGMQLGAYMIPLVGAGVWVEFEQGNPDFPIWTGCYWGSALEVPATAQLTVPGAPVLVLGSVTQNAIVLSDVPVPLLPSSGILLRAGASAYISVDQLGGITIAGTTVKILGLTDINGGALTII